MTTDKTKKLDPNRRYVVAKLRSLLWFKNTSKEIKDRITFLESDFDGFILELSNKQELVGNFEILKVSNLLISKSIVTIMFLVRSTLTNEEFEYEYTSWKNGESQNCRGVLLLENKDGISHVVVKRSLSFSTGTVDYKTIDTFYPSFSGMNTINLPSKVDKSLLNLLGTKFVKIRNFIDLGKVTLDSKMSNSWTTIFAAIIQTEEGISIKDCRGDLAIFPINQIRNLINGSCDSSLLSILVKLLSLKILTLKNE